DDLLTYLVRHRRDDETELDHDGDVDLGGGAVQTYRDTLRLALLTQVEAVTDSTEQAPHLAAHGGNARYPPSRDTRDLLDHLVGDGGAAARGGQFGVVADPGDGRLRCIRNGILRLVGRGAQHLAGLLGGFADCVVRLVGSLPEHITGAV